ncbi:MAG: 3-hydroxyacyl-ACP dehydratase FabZ [Eubacteriales bacterium]
MRVFDKEQIKSILPHREPFLLVDEAEEYVPGESIKARYKVRGDEYFFAGHFPGYPVMPGVLVLESLAQAGAVVVLNMPEYKGKIALFAGADDVRFKRQVKPGDELVLSAKLEKIKMGIGVASAVATVDGEVACSGTIKFAILRG